MSSVKVESTKSGQSEVSRKLDLTVHFYRFDAVGLRTVALALVNVLEKVITQLIVAGSFTVSLVIGLGFTLKIMGQGPFMIRSPTLGCTYRWEWWDIIMSECLFVASNEPAIC